MQVSSVSNFNYGSSKLMAHKAVDNPQPVCKDTPQPEKPVENQGVTASLYFTGKNDKNRNSLRNAAMASLGSLIIIAGAPSLSSCDKSEATAEAYSEASAKAEAYVSTHGKGCTCPECRKHRDTVYVYRPDTIIINDTIKLPGETIYVDTGSYHVTHDTITKWKYDFQKPIPLDTLAKIADKFDIPTQDPSKKNIINYQGIRDWEYGNQFIANVNLLESSRNILTYDREDLDWKGNHKGWGKDVYRIPTSSFDIETYDGRVLHSPKGMFYETYVNPWNQKTSKDDNNLVQRYFFQTIGDHVRVFSYDPETNLYREDGEFSKGYLNSSEKGHNIMLTDLIASDPDKKWSNDPEYSTEDHVVGIRLTGVNEEELRLMYLREKDDEFALEHYGMAN